MNRRFTLAENRPDFASPPTAPRVGADLALARERVGATIEEMAAHLRIRVPYLRALEDGRIADLPGAAYALAFLRTYGQALGLDSDELIRRFKAEAAAVVGRKPELAFPAPLPKRGVPASAMMLIGLLLVVGAYASWYKLSGEHRLPAETTEPVPARLASLADPPVITAENAAPATAPAPVAAKPAGTAPSTSSPPAGNGPAVSPSSAAAATTAPPPAPAAPSAPQQAEAAATPPAQLAVLATADAWVQVRSPTGSVVFSRILHAGESWPVPDQPGLLLTTGNAGGTELVHGGVAGQPLGGLGMVKRDVPLDPDRLGMLVQGAPSR